jgi:hypothetical protein
VAIWQFVTDFLTSTPTVTLDINSASTGIWVDDGYNLDPPKYAKGYAASTLRHGSQPTSSVAGNRILQIPLVLNTTDRDAAATAIQNLGAQISVDNFLKVQFGSTPVFFRTFADPDYAWEVKKTLTQESKVTLTLEAEPFAYGPRVTITGSPFTVSNNPANGTNPCRFDVTGVLGDVPTPLFMLITSTGSTGAPSGVTNKWSHIATRRRGTPSNYSNVVQAENMTQGLNATVTADATMSGGSKSRISFGTTINSLRLSDTFPENGTAVADARGEYQVYGRFAKTVAGDVITVQLGYGASSTSPVLNDTVTLPAVTGPFTTLLGKVPVPPWSDPVSHGYAGGAQLKVLLAFVGLYAARVSGSGSLDVDYLYFVPADDRTLIVRWPSTDTTYAIDGTTPEGGSVYSMNTAVDTINTIASPPAITGGGGFPELIPGQTNRIHFLRNVDPTGATDPLTDTTTIQAYYWPRWREAVRP